MDKQCWMVQFAQLPVKPVAAATTGTCQKCHLLLVLPAVRCQT